jgi:Flp pilus assembly protein TadG
MALVMSLLFTLVYGIITFGYMLSFRGSMAQSSSEGARAAATAPRPAEAAPAHADDCRVGNGRDDQWVCRRAKAATAQAVGGYGQTCGIGGTTCTYAIHDCNAGVATDSPAVLPDCITVTVVYDWAGHPLLPEMPFIGAFVPDTLRTKSVVELNDT